MNDTLNYYEINADDFVRSTRNVDFKEMQERFIAKLKKGDFILDFGCGSGRDTKYFLEKGFVVKAVDGSVQMCKIASEYTKIQVKQMLFQELADVNIYDGIWACSSILHLPYQELRKVMIKIADALKIQGIVYTSFKYGDFEGKRNGRYFTDMTEKKLIQFLEEIRVFDLEEKYITSDVRPGREKEKWLNVILRKH